MRTISICATKGGAGKSTLCTALAVHVHRLGKQVAIIDLDAGQGSTTGWATTRLRAKIDGPELVKIRSLRADLRRLGAKGTDYVFIDSPPTLDDAGRVENAVEAADFILSPCRPSILDLGAAETINNLCAGSPLAFVLVDVTTGKTWDDVNSAVSKSLAKLAHVQKQPLSHRASYVDALSEGKTGPEIDKVAGKEVATLWQEILSWME
jgi:chromosome partitioning protein